MVVTQVRQMRLIKLWPFDYTIAVRFVLQSNYPKYVIELANDMLHGVDNYPRTLDGAFDVLQLHGPLFTSNSKSLQSFVPTKKMIAAIMI